MVTKQAFRARPRRPRRLGHWLMSACLAWSAPALAMEPHVAFTELTQTADLIFEGTVSNVQSRMGPTGRSIVTDVTFDVTQLIHKKDVVGPQPLRRVVLTFAGGQVGDLGLTVSGVPTFTVGQRCVLFALFDGQAYMNPLVGGTQGLFNVVVDPSTGQRYPSTPSGRGITAVSEDELRFSERVERMDNGNATFALPEFPAEASPRSPLGDLEPAWSEAELRAGQPVELMTMDDFIAEIQLALLAPPPPNPVLRIAGRTPFEPQPARDIQKFPSLEADDDAPRAPTDGLRPELSPWTPPDDPGAPVGHVSALPDPLSQFKPDGFRPGADSIQDALTGDGPRAALCYCGGFNLFLVMEQVPAGWWEWGANNNSMASYNNFMDIYRYVADDGSYGNNNQNEFGGYPSNQDLINIYGQGWGSSIAVTWTFWTGCECCTLTQADVFFNPAFTWWQNLSDTLDQPGRVLYPPTVDHELGHSWGMQRGSCTEDYSYSQISVMHAYYYNIIEDGNGIHHPEAYSIRRLYSNQTPIINRKDVGVESYYASGSLINSTPDWSFYYTGDPITINNVTVENNSNTATGGVRIRFFLSTDNIISTGDYQMGSYWEWSSFSTEAYNTSSYSMTVPNVPAGQYYVGMIVSTDFGAYNGDDLGYNNATYLKNTITVALPAPNNDSCFNAIPIGLGTVFGTTGGASTDGSASCGSGTPDVWYSFVAPCSGTLAVNSCGSGYDTIVSLHSGCPGSAGNELGCDDDCDGVPCVAYDSCFTASVVAGNTYLIRVSGWNGQTGDFAVNLSYAPPSNDSCSGAPLTFQGETPYSNCGATTDGPADCSAFADVWFVHQATCTGYLTVSLCGSGYDTYLGVYPYADGTCPPVSGSVIQCEDDDPVCGYQSQLVLPTNIGETYLIRVGGWNGSTGEGVLNLICGECGYDTDCDDLDPCTADTCQSGTCVHDPVNCDDSDACTDDSCNALEGCVYSPVVCDDFDVCTDDSCDPILGCTYTPIVCDDGDVCTDNTCDPFAGCQYLPTDCDDFDLCTDDTCVPLAGCEYTPVLCDDFDICTDDSCDPLSGCTYTPVICDDFDPCTTDTCDSIFGCQYVPIECDDGLYCNGTEACLAGECESGSEPCVDSWCDEDADACFFYGNGDFDGDGDVDLEDAAVFQWCFGQTAAPSCYAGNLAGDANIDMSDYITFETVLSGP